MQRPSWDQYFMGIAQQVATRSTCDRKLVGAVLVKDRQILSTGYNGSVYGAPHCDSAGHELENGHCVRTVHAEANAIAQAALHGVITHRSTLYVTTIPCYSCFKLCVNAGVVRIIYKDDYGEDQRVSQGRFLIPGTLSFEIEVKKIEVEK